MTRKTGSQGVDLFGVTVELVNGTLITKRAAQRVLQHRLDITDRQARAAVSSYVAEGWTETKRDELLTINAPLCHVDSFTHRVEVHAERRGESSRENGRKANSQRGRQ